jgi:PAS domain S-box-containing protein
MSGYLLAILLPCVATGISLHTHLLRDTPLGLSFAAIFTVASFFDAGASIVVVVVTLLLFNYFFVAPFGAWALTPEALLRTGIIGTVGSMILVLGLKRQATERELQYALGSLQERTDALIRAQQGSKSAAWSFDTAERRTSWYEGGSEIFGRTLEEISAMGSPMALVLQEDLPKISAAALQTQETGVPFHVEFRITWPNGEIHWLEARGMPDSTNPAMWRGVTMDITDRKNAEFALIRSEKLAAVGRISSTIAHEVNNPLEIITNLVYLGSIDGTISSEGKGYLQQADRELSRLANLTKRTLRFVRSKSPTEPVDARAVAESIVAIFKARLESRGVCIRFSGLDGLHINVPGDDLRQVLINLISNAADALAETGGVVEIRVLRETESVSLLVYDNGAGIPAQNLKRIFDPFFTTKEAVGTGIGLWITKELVEKNGGNITVESGELADGYRTCFGITFPLAG